MTFWPYFNQNQQIKGKKKKNKEKEDTKMKNWKEKDSKQNVRSAQGNKTNQSWQIKILPPFSHSHTDKLSLR